MLEDRTRERDERQVLTGVITEAQNHRLPSEARCGRSILVEEEPGADCSAGRGPLAPGCEKTYFEVTGETHVFRRVGNTRRSAPVADLREGLRVSADHTGYALRSPTRRGHAHER